jgi:hypothetical protein
MTRCHVGSLLVQASKNQPRLPAGVVSAIKLPSTVAIVGRSAPSSASSTRLASSKMTNREAGDPKPRLVNGPCDANSAAVRRRRLGLMTISKAEKAAETHHGVGEIDHLLIEKILGRLRGPCLLGRLSFVPQQIAIANTPPHGGGCAQCLGGADWLPRSQVKRTRSCTRRVGAD